MFWCFPLLNWSFFFFFSPRKYASHLVVGWKCLQWTHMRPIRTLTDTREGKIAIIGLMVFLTKSLMSNHQTVTKPNASFGAGAQGQHPGPRAITPGASPATPLQAVPAAPVRPSPTPSLSLPHSARANPAPPIPPVSFSRRRAEAMPPWRPGGPAGGAEGQRGTPPFSPPAAMAAFRRHRRFLGGFVCGAAVAAAASSWAAWRLLRNQSRPEPDPGRALPEGKSRGQRGGRPGTAVRQRLREAGTAVPQRGPDPYRSPLLILFLCSERPSPRCLHPGVLRGGRGVPRVPAEGGGGYLGMLGCNLH